MSAANFTREDYHEFTDVPSAQIWCEHYYGAWSIEYLKNSNFLNKLTSLTDFPTDSFSAIEFYCGYDFRYINNYMRGIRSEIKNYRIYELLANTLLCIIAFAPKIPDNIVLYRIPSLEFILQFEKDIEENKYTIERGFLSTSLVKSITKSTQYHGQSNYLLKIYVKKGTMGVYTTLIPEVKRNEEQEMLLLPNGILRLIAKPYKSDRRIIYECELSYYAQFLIGVMRG